MSIPENGPASSEEEEPKPRRPVVKSKRKLCAIATGVILTLVLMVSPSKIGTPEHDDLARTLRFQVVGDWGVPVLPYDKEDAGMLSAQRRVATSMDTWARKGRPPTFVLSTGDQAYPAGIRSAAELKRLDEAMGEIYGTATPSIQSLQWHLTLGNHDCSGDRDLQYKYGKRNPKWHMEPWYRVTHEVPSAAADLTLLVLDMCTFVCGVDGPPQGRCAESDDKTFGHIPEVGHAGPKKRAQMISWLEAELASAQCGQSGKRKNWCVVAGHWPAFSFGGNGPTDTIIKELVPLMERAGVHAYFSGHDHNLQAIRFGSMHFFVSGAGGYNLHPVLKPEIAEEAEGLNKGAVSLLHHPGHGFFSVSVGKDTIEVTAVDANMQVPGSILVPYNAAAS